MSLVVTPAISYAFLEATLVESIVVKSFLLCNAIVPEACADALT